MYYLPESFTQSQSTHYGLKRSANVAEFDDDGQGSSKKAHTLAQDDGDDQSSFNTKFPYEVVSIIFENLSYKDLMSATLVCKKWKDYIADNTKLTNKILFKVPQQQQIEPFNRRYIHFDLKNLPTIEEFQSKYESEKLLVSSIKLETFSDFSHTKWFIGAFPNLKSLELTHRKKPIANCFIPRQDQEVSGLNLSKLEHLSVRSDALKFAAHGLAMITDKNKLKSLKVVLGGDNYRENLSSANYPTLMNSLKNILNSQVTLKSLHLDTGSRWMRPVPIRMSVLDDVPLNPKFKLEELKIIDYHGRDRNENSNTKFFIKKLLSSSINSCKILDFDFMDCCLTELVSMSQLEELTLGYFHIHSRSDVPLHELFASTIMKCRLKKLEIKSNFICWQLATLSSLLTQQKDSLEELSLKDKILCEHRFWNIIIKDMKKLKVLKSKQLTKTVLSKFRRNSIESLVITCQSNNIARDLLRDDDFWTKFRANNRKFKSISIEL